MIELKYNNHSVVIDQGELVNYRVNDYEFMHQKGNPGWRNSDTEMFPIIGPTAEANYEVWTPKGTAVQDQHGLLRELDYELKMQSGKTAIFQKNYIANTKVNNSKYPKKSAVKELYWPYDFQFQKIFNVTNKGLEISFKITAEEGMPYMLGYHPAFKTESKNTKIKIGDRSIELYVVQSAGSKAYPIVNTTALTLLNKGKLKIETEGFGQFMLWTEVDTMLCIEPITFYTGSVSQERLFQGYSYMGNVPEEFSVLLQPVFDDVNILGLNDCEIIIAQLEKEKRNLEKEIAEATEYDPDYEAVILLKKNLGNVMRQIVLHKQFLNDNSGSINTDKWMLRIAEKSLAKEWRPYQIEKYKEQIIEYKSKIRQIESQTKHNHIDTQHIQEALHNLLDEEIKGFELVIDGEFDFKLSISKKKNILVLDIVYRQENSPYNLGSVLKHLEFEDTAYGKIKEVEDFTEAKVLNIIELLSIIFFEGFFQDTLKKPLQMKIRS